MQVNCKICKKEFNYYPSRIRKYCSFDCYNKWRKSHPEENYFYKNQLYGDKNGNWKGGITRLTQSIRNSSKYSEMRIECFYRDKYTCQICRRKSTGDIETHHIKELSKLLKENNITNILQALSCNAIWDTENIITLCNKCHKKTDNHSWKSTLKKMIFNAKLISFNKNKLKLNVDENFIEKIKLLANKGKLKVKIGEI